MNILSKVSALNSLVLETFRLNGALVGAGDALVAELGLTSARWQVLGAVAKADTTPSISEVARAMGLSRQAVRRVVNDLISMGLLKEVDAPEGARSRRLLLSEAGSVAHCAADAKQQPWATEVSADFDASVLEAAAATVRRLRERIQTL